LGLVILSSAILFMWNSHVSTAQGPALAPDPRFGSNGKVRTKFKEGGTPYKLASRGNGDVLVAGRAFIDKKNPGRSVGAIVEYGPDGERVQSFGQAGLVVNQNMNYANALIEQPDGKLLVVGQTAGTPGQQAHAFVIARYNPDGSLDGSFGDAGEVVDSYAGPWDGVATVVLQPDGKILVAGVRDTTQSGASEANGDFAIARYNQDGTLDATFGTSGKVVTDFDGLYDLVTAVIVQSDGKILAGGYAETAPQTYGIGLARYNPNGTLDSTFGDSGKTLASLAGASEEIGCLAIDPAGDILAGGIEYFDGGNQAKPVLARFNSAGALDASFGNGGSVDLSNIQGGLISAIRIQPDGRIFVSGFTLFPYAPIPTSVFSLRQNPDGTPDTGYNATGLSQANFYGSFGQVYVGILEPNGEFLAAGYDRTGFSKGFLVLRYQTGAQ
jgi:uncharacterized delta-60 repeat protein